MMFNISINTFEEINDLNTIFLILFMVTGGIFLSCIITSSILNLSYEHDIDEGHNEYINVISKEYDEDYIYKYDDLFEAVKLEYMNYEMKENDKKALKNKFITEKTPKGDVIMSYNYYQDDTSLSSFYYYCNDTSIQYNILETVAKKYVCENKCLFFFISNDNDNNDTPISYIQDNKEINNKNDNNDNNNKNIESLFANFKSYNSNKNTNSNKNNKVINLVDKNVERNSILKNRFTRLGNINDYNEAIDKMNLKGNRSSTIQNISFSDFKKQKIN